LEARAHLLREHTLDFGESTFSGRGGCAKAKVARDQEAQGEREGFLFREEERGEFVTWTQAIGSIASSHGLYGDAKVL